MTGVEGRSRILWVLAASMAMVFLISLFIGRYPEPGMISIERVFNDEIAARLVTNLRLPRLITAALLGMALSSAGTVFQMLFGNPLVEPGFLGVSQGAAFGTALAIIFLGSSAWLIQICAAGFAFLGLFLSFSVARRVRFGGWVLRLILAGIVISAIFSAGLGIMKYMADPLSQLPELTFWLLGSLTSITWPRLSSMVLVVIVGLIILILMRWRLNLLSLTDEVSFSLGVSTGRERALILVAATAATAAVISVSGMVQWVGLIVPHISRRIFGADTRYSLPGSIFIGGIFAMICDDFARTLLPGEIPLGIITSFAGAGFFLALMLTQRLKIEK